MTRKAAGKTATAAAQGDSGTCMYILLLYFLNLVSRDRTSGDMTMGRMGGDKGIATAGDDHR